MSPDQLLRVHNAFMINFDLALGTPGLHVVRRRAEWIERDTVLPPDLFARFTNDAFWRTPEAMRRGVPTIHIQR